MTITRRGPSVAHWLVTFKDKTTATYSREDWQKARELPRLTFEGDFSYRCRAWSAYLGKAVIDWESIDAPDFLEGQLRGSK